MEESKRQKQVGRMLEEELNEIFRKKGWNVMGRGMVSISRVKVTPDLAEAKIYLSLFQIDDKDALLEKIERNAWEVRKELGTRIRNNVRKIPELSFYDDDTLEYVSKIEKVLERIKKKDNENLND
jgi:ribosome-binding factor A